MYELVLSPFNPESCQNYSSDLSALIYNHPLVFTLTHYNVLVAQNYRMDITCVCVGGCKESGKVRYLEVLTKFIGQKIR